MNNKMLVLAAALLLAAVLLSGCATGPETGSGEKASVSFKAFAGEQTVLDRTIEVEKGTNAFDALQAIASIGFTDYGEMGVFVERINGVSPAENQFWKLSVNGEEATVGISSITIEEDIEIEWKTEGIESYGD